MKTTRFIKRGTLWLFVCLLGNITSGWCADEPTSCTIGVPCRGGTFSRAEAEKEVARFRDDATSQTSIQAKEESCLWPGKGLVYRYEPLDKKAVRGYFDGTIATSANTTSMSILACIADDSVSGEIWDPDPLTSRTHGSFSGGSGAIWEAQLSYSDYWLEPGKTYRVKGTYVDDVYKPGNLYTDVDGCTIYVVLTNGSVTYSWKPDPAITGKITANISPAASGNFELAPGGGITFGYQAEDFDTRVQMPSGKSELKQGNSLKVVEYKIVGGSAIGSSIDSSGKYVAGNQFTGSGGEEQVTVELRDVPNPDPPAGETGKRKDDNVKFTSDKIRVHFPVSATHTTDDGMKDTANKGQWYLITHWRVDDQFTEPLDGVALTEKPETTCHICLLPGQADAPVGHLTGATITGSGMTINGGTFTDTFGVGPENLPGAIVVHQQYTGTYGAYTGPLKDDYYLEIFHYKPGASNGLSCGIKIGVPAGTMCF